MNSTLPWQSERSHERGLVIVYVAILALLMIGLLGLALDGAFVASTSQQLQHAADAAALNAVRYVQVETDTTFPETRAAAMAVALANEAAKTTIKLDANTGNSATGDIVVGYFDYFARTFTPTVTGANAVRVHANRTAGNTDGKLSLLFAPIFGKNDSDVGVTSTAILAAAADPLVLILDPTSSGSLSLNGDNSLNVQAGRIHVDSSSACGINMVGGPVMVAMKTSVVGGACYPSGALLGPLLEDADYVPDPLAFLLPTNAAWDTFKSSLPKPLGNSGQINATGTYSPGYYPLGLDAQSSENITLQPGYYMFGKGVTLGGNAHVTGYGVTLFIDKLAKNQDVDIEGSDSGFLVTPPGPGDPFQGVSMFFHRENTGSALCKIGGGGAFEMDGTLYIASGQLQMAGTPGKELGGIIAWQAETKGVTGYVITGKGVKPSTGPLAAFLVE